MAAWPLDCCRDAFDADNRLWLRRLTEGGGSFVSGDKALLHDLLSDVRAAGGSVAEASGTSDVEASIHFTNGAFTPPATLGSDDTLTLLEPQIALCTCTST